MVTKAVKEGKVGHGYRLLPADDIQPSTYNPRIADPARLELIALSLRKLGFLLPIYATPEGEILSGHQRHHVAVDMLGWDRLPVATTRSMELHERKSVNIAFNRGTNDLDRGDTSTSVTAALSRADVVGLAEALPDVAGDGRFPCMTASSEPIGPLLAANSGRWVQYARNLAGTMDAHGVVMPVVVGPDGVAANGVGRLEMLAQRGAASAVTVRIGAGQAELAAAMLNLLSMDFDVEERYADFLRHNSFRRAVHVRGDGVLGLGFTFALGVRTANKFRVNEPGQADVWKATYGERVVDFGAGHRHETQMLRAHGVDSVPFEPFLCAEVNGNAEIDPDRSRELCSAFLDDVRTGAPYSSVFCSSVLNSVPFKSDREHIMAILAALAYPRSTTYIATLSTQTAHWKARDLNYVNPTHGNSIAFPLDYEPGVMLKDLGAAPKIKKHHTAEEMYHLCVPFWRKVQSRQRAHNIYVTAVSPRKPDPARLAAALEFEFDLLYPDRSRLGLVDAAKEAFGRRLRTPIP